MNFLAGLREDKDIYNTKKVKIEKETEDACTIREQNT